MDLVNTQKCRGLKPDGLFQEVDVITEDVADGLRVQSDIFGNADERSFKRLLLYEFNQSLCGHPFFVHIVTGLKEGFQTFLALAAVPLSDHNYSGPSAVCRNIHKELLFLAKANNG